MRFFCNLLVGIPLFGLFAGAVLLIVQSFTESGGYWLKELSFCQEAQHWYVQDGSLVREMSSSLLFACDLPNGALLILVSILLGLISIPLATAIARAKKF